MRFFLHDLPYKFLNHASGSISRLGQHSKFNVVPNDYIAIAGDSNAYGFGPWLLITHGVEDNLISRHITYFIPKQIQTSSHLAIRGSAYLLFLAAAAKLPLFKHFSIILLSLDFICIF